MARGQEGKSKRKAARKEARLATAEELLNSHVNEFDQQPDEDEDGDEDEDDNDHDDDDEDEDDDDEDEDEDEQKGEGGMPLPAGMSKEKKKLTTKKKKKAVASADSSDDSDDDDTPMTRQSRAGKATTRRAAASTTPKKKEGIKTLPLIMLIMLTGTTVLPALLFLGDKLGAIAQKKHLLGNIGYRLGVGPSPKKRVLSFYEKHDPAKVDEVPNILAKYYGDYPKLVKRLERKYGDYGYFLNWEDDEAPMTLAFDQLRDTRDKIQEQWNRHAPEFAKTGARNAQSNLAYLHRKGRMVWKKKVWPILEPYFGVPDAKAARDQKRKDAQAANAARPGRRKKNTEYRDDDAEE